MRFWGSNQRWGGKKAGVAADMTGRRPGLHRRLWSRLRGYGPELDGGSGRTRRPPVRGSTDGQPLSHLAAPRAVTSPDASLRHVAQATGGPFVETRLAREIRRLVASLGTTRGEIALALERHGVRAVPHGRGPVACFLEAVIAADPNVKSVVVDAESVVAELRAWWRPTVVVKLPPVMLAFQAAFDACCYPRLLAHGYRASAQGERPGE